MKWEIEYTDEFGLWWDSLNEDEQISVDAVVGMLAEKGSLLSFPYSSGIKDSKHGSMRELRIQHKGYPYRVLYAFDPRRAAILLVGGNKTGDSRWYDRMIPIADRLFAEHLRELKKGEI